MSWIGLHWLAIAGLSLELGAAGQPAFGAEYFHGKTINLVAGQPPGGGIDIEMRLVAASLGKFISGEPQVQPRNMPGAGGIALGNQLYNVALPDGLTLGMPGRAGFVLGSITDEKSARYDVRKFTWIGSMEGANFIFWARKDLGVSTTTELRGLGREIIVAASGSTTANSIIPEILAKYGGPKFKVVRGYPGIADAVLAVERGEADAIYCDRASLRPDMIDNGLVKPIFQTFPAIPGLPVIDELMGDDGEKRLVKLLTTPMRLGLPVIGPPGLPGDVTEILRNGYERMASSAEYQNQLRQRSLDVGKVNRGDALAREVTAAFAEASDDVVAEYRAFATKN